jgi:hypothetical protein
MTFAQVSPGNQYAVGTVDKGTQNHGRINPA